MKKVLWIFVIVCLLVISCSGCGPASPKEAEAPQYYFEHDVIKASSANVDILNVEFENDRVIFFYKIENLSDVGIHPNVWWIIHVTATQESGDYFKSPEKRVQSAHVVKKNA